MELYISFSWVVVPLLLSVSIHLPNRLLKVSFANMLVDCIKKNNIGSINVEIILIPRTVNAVAAEDRRLHSIFSHAQMRSAAIAA